MNFEEDLLKQQQTIADYEAVIKKERNVQHFNPKAVPGLYEDSGCWTFSSCSNWEAQIGEGGNMRMIDLIGWVTYTHTGDITGVVVLDGNIQYCSNIKDFKRYVKQE